MCEFLSFFVSVKENQIACGDPTSHSNASVHSGMGDWREAEWTGPRKDSLEIRVNSGEDLSAYLATVFGIAKTRKTLIKRLSPSKDASGNVFHFTENGLHRDPKDGPAYIWANGTQQYYWEGRLHRDPKDGPAIIWANGTQEYWWEDQLHRDPKDGPAYIEADGTQEYWWEDQLHRDPKDGPARIWADGSQEYWWKGERVEKPKK